MSSDPLDAGEYLVEYSPAARRQIKKLNKTDRDTAEEIVDAIDDLANDPRPLGCKQLANENGLVRIPVGEYCVVYSVDDDERRIEITKIRPRRDVYKH